MIWATVLEIFKAKNNYFEINKFKTVACIKRFRSIWFLRPNKALWGLKKVFLDPKNTKNWFSQKIGLTQFGRTLLGTPTVPSYKVPSTSLVENSFNSKFASSLVCKVGQKCPKFIEIVLGTSPSVMPYFQIPSLI